MSAVAERMPLGEALALAGDAAVLLSAACERIVIAGSIRRRRDTIGDLELVAEPRFATTMGGLFGDIPERANLLDARCDELVADGTFGLRLDVNGRPANGSHLKRLTYRGRPLDLFAEDRPERWGVTLLLRTGSGAFNKRLVTQRAEGGWMPSGLRMRGAAIERIAGDHWEPAPTYTEESVFELLGRPYIRPEQREV